jgi:chemotaxis protein MotA
VEPASLIGLILMLVGVFVGMVIKGADPVALFTNVPAILIVFLGSLGATMISHSMAENKTAVKALKKVFLPGTQPVAADAVERISELANQARSEGLLALESEASSNPDPFFRKGLQLAVDGTDAQTLQEIMVAEIKATKERHKAAAGWFTQAGIFAPTFGIIGAVVGLIAVLSKLDDPSKLGHGIGAAFVATFWGIFLANGLFLPFSNKLKRLSADEMAYRELTLQGIMALQAGTSPRAVEEKLSGYLPPSARKAS